MARSSRPIGSLSPLDVIFSTKMSIFRQRPRRAVTPRVTLISSGAGRSHNQPAHCVFGAGRSCRFHPPASLWPGAFPASQCAPGPLFIWWLCGRTRFPIRSRFDAVYILLVGRALYSLFVRMGAMLAPETMPETMPKTMPETMPLSDAPIRLETSPSSHSCAYVQYGTKKDRHSEC